VAILAALLFTPALYYTQMLTAERDLFYAALTLALVASATALAAGGLGRPRGMALLTGFLGGWFWLTREEGVWILPCLALLLAVPLLGLRRRELAAGPGPDAPPARLRAAGVALGVAVVLVVGVGLINWAVYGRFVVNEVKDRPFQSAMRALEDASAPFHHRGVPVPAAARARIYAVSPAFASLREPVLDGRWQANALQAGCQENPDFCHDYGGGWFMWVLRSSAATHGQHESAPKAAAFYAQLAREVRQACADGRLACGRWVVPLVPPMKAEELGDVAHSIGRVLHILTFGEPVYMGPLPSDLSAPTARSMVVFLNAPVVQGETTPVRVSGWFVADGARWFALKAPEGVKLQEFSRGDSPDLVGHFKDPRVTRQRFAIAAECPTVGTCPVRLTPEGGAPVHLDLNGLGPGAHRIAGGTFYVDSVDTPAGATRGGLLKVRLSRAWLAVVARLNPIYRALAVSGAAAYGALVIAALARRRISTGLVICTALLAAVATRVLILSLIDALSFVAASFGYGVPGIVLLVLFSVLSLHELAVTALAWRSARAAAPVSTAASVP
jgi:hypothetical protein